MWGQNMLLNTMKGGSWYLAADHMLVLFAVTCFISFSAWVPIDVKWAAFTCTNVGIVSMWGRGSEFLLLIPVVLGSNAQVGTPVCEATNGVSFFSFCKPQHPTDRNQLWLQCPLEAFLQVSYPAQLNTHICVSTYACNFRNPCSWVSHTFKARQAKRKRTVQFFFSSWSFLASEENKKEGEEEVVTVFLSGGYLLHATVNSRLWFSLVSPKCCVCCGRQGLINRPPSLMWPTVTLKRVFIWCFVLSCTIAKLSFLMICEW